MYGTIYFRTDSSYYDSWAVVFKDHLSLCKTKYSHICKWIDYQFKQHPEWDYYFKCPQCHERMITRDNEDFEFSLYEGITQVNTSHIMFMCDTCSIKRPHFRTLLAWIRKSYPATDRTKYKFEMEHLINVEKIATDPTYDTNIVFKFVKGNNMERIV